MPWQKKGLIYKPEGRHGWDHNTVLTPTPFLLSDEIIRIYAGFRDERGVSRIGYIDVDAENPKNVLRTSAEPVLDIGKAGTFDDNGLILGDVVRHGKEILLYYVGFQIPSKVKFMAYSGLAISQDGGNSFTRYKKTPIMDRTDNALYIRAIHTVMFDEGIWKIWYSVGNDWEIINDIPYPQYDIRYVESRDGFHIDDDKGFPCLPVGANEYRIGRPRVTKCEDGSYIMRYTSDTFSKEYKAGYATSKNGINWVRQDDKIELPPSKSGWDSEMICYPVTIKVKNQEYIFYSGNGMGLTGVGYAEWEGS